MKSSFISRKGYHPYLRDYLVIPSFCFLAFCDRFSSIFICFATNNRRPIAILKLNIDEPPKLINGRGTPVNGIVAKYHLN